MVSKPRTAAGANSGASRLVLPAVILLLALVPAMAAYHSAGIVEPTDAGMLALGLAGIVGFAIMARALRGSDLSGRAPWRITLVLLVVALVAILATLMSTQRFTSLLGAPASSTGLAQAMTLSMIAVGAAFAATTQRKVLVVVAPWVIGFELLVATVQQVSGAHPAGTLSNSTFLGQVVVVLLPLAVGPYIKREGTPALLAWGGGIVAIGLLAWLDSMLAAVVGGVLLVAMATLPRVRWRPAGNAILAALVAGALILAVLPVGVSALASSDSAIDQRLGARPYLWDAAATVIGSSPLAGSGIDTYRVAASPYVADGVTTVEGSGSKSFASLAGDPHNLVMRVLVDVGIVGLLLAAWLLFEIARNWKAQSETKGAAPNWAMWGTIAFLATGILAPLPLQTLGLLAVVAGASLRPEFPSGSKGLLERVGAARVQWIFGAIALVCAVLVVAYAGTRVWVGATEPGPAEADRTARSSTLWSSDSFLAFWEARQWWQASDGPSANAATERAVTLDPDNAFLWLDRARILSIFAPDEPEVLPAFERAEELFPASVEVPLHRGRYLLEQGDPEGAAADVERALALAPNDPEVQQLAIDVELAR